MPYRQIPTDAGVLRGFDDGSVLALLGVEYGQTTAGEGRFRAPRPVQPWRGVRDALEFGPGAPQSDTRLASSTRGNALLRLLYPRGGGPLEGGPMGEDCLRLNIWAPANAEVGSLPVIVWLHGGGYVHGSGNEMAFNGDILASAAEAVVVTVTHRLGLLGFLDLRDHGYPDSANAGMLDIVQALEWVRANIAQVGGDPERVTVAGQSGGSGKVAALHAMPAAQGLFARAIMMSGPFTAALPREHTHAVAERVLVAAQMSASALADAPVDVVLNAQSTALRPVGADVDAGSISAALDVGPALDDRHLPADPFASPDLVIGKQLMIGATDHEFGMFLIEDDSYTPRMTREEAIARLEGAATEAAPTESAPTVDASAMYDAVSAAHPQEPPHLVLSRALSEHVFARPAHALADAVSTQAESVWVYQFEQRTDVLDGAVGSCHSLDLAYAFGTVDRIPLTGSSPARRETSAEVMNAWAAFARDGRPRGTTAAWKPWNASTRTPYRFVHRD